MTVKLADRLKEYYTSDFVEPTEGVLTPLEECKEFHYSYTEEVGDIRLVVSTSDGEFMKWYLSESRHANQK